MRTSARPMVPLTRFIIHVVLPTVIGSFIYIGWRSTDLLAFRWLELLGLSSIVFRPELSLPDWVLFSLPDGCWAYATTSWMLLIWKRLTYWAWLVPVLAIGSELGQMFGVVPGTYQTLDVIFYAGAFFLAGALHAETPIIGHRYFNYGSSCTGQ